MNHQTRVYDTMLEMLSNAENPTPIVRLHRVSPFRHTVVYAKLEWYNPFGAVKDRVAYNLIADAEKKGLLKAGTNLVEPTSGNTGMGLAMIANARHYKFTATLSNKIPLEKRASLRLFGSNVVELDDDLCPAPGAPEGAIALAARLGHEPGNYHLDQYKNPANPEAHYLTTGPEIWRQTEGNVTHFVAGLGTCGTITGTGRFLKEKSPKIKVFGAHPAEGHDIPGVRSLRQLSQTALFFPKEYDGLCEVPDPEAFELCRRLNQEESIIAGPSSAMALAAAFKLVPDEPGNLCVVIFPDNAFKYTSSMRKHLPALFKGAAGPAAEPKKTPPSLDKILDFARASPDVLSPADAQRLIDQKKQALIDVRTVEEFAPEHLAGSVNVPLADLAAGTAAGLPEDKHTEILAICRVGERSLQALLILKSMGYHRVRSLRGGLKAWTAAGLPVEHWT
jgi:cysteine synthase/rhodanese-related sulfurtransferase